MSASEPDGDPDLPLDPDEPEAAAESGRPPYRSVANIALVAAGGAVGTGLRYGTSTIIPHWSEVPVGIAIINVLGAFVLGLLLETLLDQGSQVRWAQRLRLALGTGVLGGFTTYSALAADTALLLGRHPGLAVGYGLGTVVLGGLASAAGISLARTRLRPLVAGVGR